jgi:hypothetical protein
MITTSNPEILIQQIGIFRDIFDEFIIEVKE